jgi:DME family drug/metabolite transporter
VSGQHAATDNLMASATDRGTKRTSPFLATIAVVCAGVLWGSIGIFVRAFNATGLQALDISEIRAAGCAVMMLVVLVIRDHRLPRIRLKDLWCFLGSGLLSIFLFNVCYFSTIEHTSMSVAAVLLYTAPAFVMLLSRVLFAERFTRRKILALILTFIGCCLTSNVFSGHAVLSARGIVTGIMSGVGYALYTIFSRYALNRGYDTFTIVFYTFLITAIGGAPLTAFPRIGNAVAMQPSTLLVMFGYVLLTTVLAYALYTYGLIRMENSRASIVVSIEPVAATTFGFLFFGEVPTLSVLLGMAAVLSAIVMVNLPSSNHEGAPNPLADDA